MGKLAFISTAFLVLGLLLSGCKAMQEDKGRADKVAKDMLDMIAAGDSDKMYDQYMTPACQGVTDKQRTAKLVAACRRKLGAPKSFNLVGQHVLDSNGVIRGQYSYQVQWEKASGTLSLGTVTTGDVMKLDSFRVDSDAFLEDATSAPTTKPN